MNIVVIVTQVKRRHRKWTHATADAIGLEVQAADPHTLVHLFFGYFQIMAPLAHLLRSTWYGVECNVLIIVPLALTTGHTTYVHAVAGIHCRRSTGT